MMKIRFVIKQLPRWIKMALGRSKFHHKFSLNGVNDSFLYPIDFSDKVKYSYDHVNGIAKVVLNSGERVDFPIMQAQLALGYWDIYIKNNSLEALSSFCKYSQHLTLLIQDGRVETWTKIRPDLQSQYSSMAQSLVASVLWRYEVFVLNSSPDISLKLIDEMLKEDLKNCKYLCLEEIPSSDNSCVLNGWLYSVFSMIELEMFDISRNFSQPLKRQMQSIEKYLPMYLCRFGSYYDLSGNYASPFYHSLHILQLKFLLQFYGERFHNISSHFERRNTAISRFIQFFLKAYQKIREKPFNEIQN